MNCVRKATAGIQKRDVKHARRSPGYRIQTLISDRSKRIIRRIITLPEYHTLYDPDWLRQYTDRLRARIRGSIPGRGRDFSITRRVYTGSGVHPIKYVPVALSPGVKQTRREADSHLVLTVRKHGAVTPLFHTSSWRCASSHIRGTLPFPELHGKLSVNPVFV
jgi:hypothetical protein